MAHCVEVLQLLHDLAQHSAALSNTESLEEYKTHAKDVCRSYVFTLQQLAGIRGHLQALGSAFWQELADEGIAVADATKTLNALMRYGSTVQACIAAVVYSWLLRAPDAPVHNMLDALTFSGCLQRIKETAFASSNSSSKPSSKSMKASQQQSKAMQADDDDADDGEAGPSQAHPASAAADLEVALCLCCEALANLAVVVKGVQLRNSQEVLQAGLEGCSDLLSCNKTAKVPASSKKMGLLTGSISTAAYDLLTELFQRRHGCMQDMAALLLPRLTPLMVGAVMQAGKRTASEAAASRAAAVNFVRQVYSNNRDIQDAVAALVRHVCLKAPDKADCRAAAVKAVTDLVTDLPQWEQEQFAGFVFNLSRTNKLGLRTLSVGLANSLLMNLPEPFKRSTFEAAAAQAAADAQAEQAAAAAVAAATTSSGGVVATPAPTRAAAASVSCPPGMVVAPWSVVALAALLHRCSDKSAVVRGRALSDLAEVVDCFASLLAEDPASEQHQVAEAFVEGLGAAAALQMAEPRKAAATQQRQKKKKAAKAGESEDDEEEEEEGDTEPSPAAGRNTADGAAAATGGAREEDEGMADGAGSGGQGGNQQQQHMACKASAVFVAYMPGQLSADLHPVTSLVHRRCGDPKAAVRRGALQLLEALLVMRASWQGYPRQLPGSADLAQLEAATADPLVSVRKAALVALSTLLELFPAEPSLCHAWVASALPLVRDVEASIQDSLADWAAALLFDKASAASAATQKKPSRKAAAAAAADTEDMEWQGEGTEAQHAEAAAGNLDPAAAADDATFAELRQLLSAVASVGRAAAACLGKLCASMAAKKKLKAVAVARGLEAVIARTATGSPAALGAYILLKEIAAQEPAAPSWQFLQQRWAAVRAAATAATAGAGALAAVQQAAAAAQPAAAAETGGASQASQPHQAEAASATVGLAEEAAALLLVISETAAGFPAAQAQALAGELLGHTLSFQLPPTAAGAHVAALFHLTEAAGGAGSGSSAGAAGGPGFAGPPAQWAKQVFTAALERLRRYTDVCSAGGVSDPQQDHTVYVALFTVGEVALLRAAKPPSGLIVLLQALTAHKFIPSSATRLSQMLSQSQAVSQALGGSQLDPHAGPDSSQAAGGGSLGGLTQPGSDVPAAAASGRPVPACVQAHAWISLGKVCMVDEALAKKCVPLFVQELGRSSLPVVRNNILVALSDMLIQYTALVDAHMPRLAACMRDRHELVRRQALALLANLLMKDYVKWRGPLFHRFLLALVDPSPAVRQLAEYLLRDVIAVKAPLLAYNHFVEALFVLNGCTAGMHGARLGANLAAGGAAGVAAGAGGGGGAGMALPAEGAAGADAETEQSGEGDGLFEAWMVAPAQFTLKGRQDRPARDLIYSALLKSMSAEHKFSSAAKLCGEVLAGVADGLLPLQECEEVLRDALCLLASKDIKVSASRLAAADEDEPPPTQAGAGAAAAAAGGSATAAEAAARARGKLVSALMKRHLVEQVVPVLVELRRLLAELKHPLLCELMGCFAALLKEYKGEVEDILVADKQLAKEILYDIKQAELAKQQQQAAAATRPASAAGSSAAAVAAAAPGRYSPPPTGVLPGTPVAAEVLATAERQRREQLQKLRQQQQQQAAAGAACGDMPAPSPRPPHAQRTPALSVLQTPAAARGTASKSRLANSSDTGQQPQPQAHSTAGWTAAAAGGGAFQTPAAKASGAAGGAATVAAGAASTGAGAGAGGAAGLKGVMMASPAPLTVSKRASRGSRAAAAAGGNENQEPGAAAGAGCGAPSVSEAAAHLLQRPSPSEAPTNVLLPSPYRPTPKRQWNIPQHVATGEKTQQQQQQQQQQEASEKDNGRRGGRRAASKKAAAEAAGVAAVVAGAAAAPGRAARGSGRPLHGALQPAAAAPGEDGAGQQQQHAASGRATAGSGGRRVTRGQKEAAAGHAAAIAAAAEEEDEGEQEKPVAMTAVAAVKMEQAVAAAQPEVGGRRAAGTRKRRNV